MSCSLFPPSGRIPRKVAVGVHRSGTLDIAKHSDCELAASGSVAVGVLVLVDQSQTVVETDQRRKNPRERVGAFGDTAEQTSTRRKPY